MNAKMSRHLTLLGLWAMAFYGVMLATGTLSLEVMPQFVVSALIFLTSGRLLRRTARVRNDEEEAEGKACPARVEPDWPWLTALLNWTAALLIIGVMAILIMMPVGISFSDALTQTNAYSHYFSTAVP
jgi:hypothetical protein